MVVVPASPAFAAPPPGAQGTAPPLMPVTSSIRPSNVICGVVFAQVPGARVIGSITVGQGVRVQQRKYMSMLGPVNRHVDHRQLPRTTFDALSPNLGTQKRPIVEVLVDKAKPTKDKSSTTNLCHHWCDEVNLTVQQNGPANARGRAGTASQQPGVLMPHAHHHVAHGCSRRALALCMPMLCAGYVQQCMCRIKWSVPACDCDVHVM